MRKLTLYLGLILMGLCSVPNAHAQTYRNKKSSGSDSFAQQWGVGVKATTNGIGFEIIKGFGEKVNLRIGNSSLSLPIETVYNVQGYDLAVHADLNFSGFNGFIDYHLLPWLHVSGGIAKNNMYHTVRITSVDELALGTIDVPVEEVGFVMAELYPETDLAPYLGLGFGTTMSRKSNFSFNFEIGGIYQGEPQLVLTGDGIIGPIASVENQDIIKQALAPYKWYPLVSVQLSFRIQ